MTDIRNLIETELSKRLAAMPTDELLRLAFIEGANLPRTQTPPPADLHRPSLRSALVTVMRASTEHDGLSSNEIVERVMQVRPGTPDPSIRSEISRARAMGVLRLHGEPRGGRYTLSRSTIRPRAAVGT